jgi:protein subunit release factor A
VTIDPQQISIPDGDDELLAQCRVETFRAGGPGGQHQNKTESGVRLTHRPTGIRVIAREARSQSRNRTVALERLRARLTEMNLRPEPRIETKVPPRTKRRRLEGKKRRADTKKLRKPPIPED